MKEHYYYAAYEGDNSWEVCYNDYDYFGEVVVHRKLSREDAEAKAKELNNED